MDDFEVAPGRHIQLSQVRVHRGKILRHGRVHLLLMLVRIVAHAGLFDLAEVPITLKHPMVHVLCRRDALQ